MPIKPEKGRHKMNRYIFKIVREVVIEANNIDEAELILKGEGKEFMGRIVSEETHRLLTIRFIKGGLELISPIK